jgi:hypothetical protein
MRFSVALSIVAVWKVTSVLSTGTLIGVSESADFHIETPKCYQDYNDSKVSASCKTKSCARHVEDGLFSGFEIDLLHEIVNKGMNTRPARGGPTILDINTGGFPSHSMTSFYSTVTEYFYHHRLYSRHQRNRKLVREDEKYFHVRRLRSLWQSD